MIILEPIYRSQTNQYGDQAAKINCDDNYIAWFRGQQSTGLWYYKRIIMESSSNKPLLIKVPENSIFKLYDTNIDTGDNDFIDNKHVLKNAIKSEQLYKQMNKWYHQFYVVGHADEPGEFIEKIEAYEILNGISNEDEVIDYSRLTISETPVDSIQVGMEVYGENEALRINLQNMGVELPDNIVNSIYETDLYEERTDWVTLNNKWRELMINYMDVAGCKGNYKSLENSLEWFNYGRLIELRECWKQHTPDGIKFMDRPLNRWLSDWYNKSLAGIARTTYMVIRQCSVDLTNKIGTELAPSLAENEGFESDDPRHQVPVYQPYTYDPARIAEDDLTESEIKWAKDEMRMKMTLLGLFFETNFMPVHLDLLRCSVEDIVFDIPYVLCMDGAAELEASDSYGMTDMDVHSNGKDNEPDEDGFDVVVHLDQQNVYGADVSYRNSTVRSGLNFGINTRINLKNAAILGVSYDAPPTILEEGQREAFNLGNVGIMAMGWYNDIGAVADIDLITDQNVSKGKLTTNITGSVITRTSDISCSGVVYNVDWQGNIINYDETYDNIQDGVIRWTAGLKYYKTILADQYAIVNQYGLPVDDTRFNEPQDDWIEWTDDADYDFEHTYYRKTSSHTYVIVNGLGQQIDDNRYKGKPADDLIEWKVDLRYQKRLYKTNVKLLCTTPGEFWALFQLDGSTTTYNRRVNIKVVDNLDVRLEFFKLVWDDTEKDPFDPNNLGPNRNMFVTTRVPDTDTEIYSKQNWRHFISSGQGTTFANTLYEIPKKVISDYKYQQYLPLSVFFGPKSFEELQDKPRLSWVATISPLDGDSMEDPTQYLGLALDQCYYKKGYEYDTTGLTGRDKYIYNEDRQTGRLTYMQLTPKLRDSGEATLENVVASIKSRYKIKIEQKYIAEYHTLSYIDPDENTDISIEYPIIAVPVIELNVNGKRRDLTWSHELKNPAWKFYSYAVANYVDQLNFNVQQPFIISQYRQYTPMGRYKIDFTYKWGAEEKTISRMSPFNIIHV